MFTIRPIAIGAKPKNPAKATKQTETEHRKRQNPALGKEQEPEVLFNNIGEVKLLEIKTVYVHIKLLRSWKCFL